ncbi:MAG: hypothetical protein AAF447_20620 [Myxococcota bacterium]
MSEFADRARAWLGANRRRVARLVAVVAVLLVAGQLAGAVPRATDLRFEVDGGTTELDVAYLHLDDEGGAEELQSVRFGGPGGVPSLVRHEVELSPGRYRARAVVRRGRDAREVERVFEVPAPGVVRLDLRAQP